MNSIACSPDRSVCFFTRFFTHPVSLETIHCLISGLGVFTHGTINVIVIARYHYLLIVAHYQSLHQPLNAIPKWVNCKDWHFICLNSDNSVEWKSYWLPGQPIQLEQWEIGYDNWMLQRELLNH